MLRKIAGFLALLIAAGLSMADQDRKDAKKIPHEYVIGTFESYKDELLTLTIKDEEKKFKVPGDTPVGYSTGKADKTKILKAKEHLKDLKKGTVVSVTLSSNGKKVVALGVIVSELPKDKPKDKDEESDK